MARALAVQVHDVETGGDEVTIAWRVVFFGADLPASDQAIVRATIGPTDAAVQARAKLVAAVLAAAQERGYAVTANRVVAPMLAMDG